MPRDHQTFSKLKKFLRGKSFCSDDEMIATLNDYLIDPHLEFFSEGVERLNDRWLRVVAS